MLVGWRTHFLKNDWYLLWKLMSEKPSVKDYDYRGHILVLEPQIKTEVSSLPADVAKEAVKNVRFDAPESKCDYKEESLENIHDQWYWNSKDIDYKVEWKEIVTKAEELWEWSSVQKFKIKIKLQSRD